MTPKTVWERLTLDWYSEESVLMPRVLLIDPIALPLAERL